MNKIKNLTAILFAVFLILFIIPCIVKIIKFPNEISIIEGSERQFDLSIPAVEASFEDDASVSFADENDFKIKGNKVGSTDLRLSVLGITIKNINVSVIPNSKLIPSGKAVGVIINTDGIMVLGIGSVKGEDGKNYMPSENVLRSGDMIISVNDKKISDKNELTKAIEDTQENAVFLISRNNTQLKKTITPVKSADGTKKIGVWVRDSTQGIGTITYIDPNTMTFGGLGHGITDVDTKKLMTVKDGKILDTSIKSVVKSEKGQPGALSGSTNLTSKLGNITINTERGIFGNVSGGFEISTAKPLEIALNDEIKEGKAYILSTVDGSEPQKYEIEIESINRFNSDASKSMVIRVTDKRLIDKTNGIVQGMSGSPIIQNGKIAGAVTHVFVKNPEKGYGIFIENMLKQEKHTQALYE